MYNGNIIWKVRVSCSPDIFQSKINELLGDLDYIRAYLDDVLVL